MKFDKNTTVLIADDEPITRKILHSMLTSFGIKQIYEAGNGEQALQLGLQHKPQYALLDIYMPKMDGWEVVRRFKQELPDTILVMVSSSRDIADIEKSFSEEVDGYVYKPFKQDELLKKLTDLTELRAMIKAAKDS